MAATTLPDIILQLWAAWLAAAPVPTEEPSPELDDMLRDFALGPEMCFTSPPLLPGAKRVWLRRRAQQLGCKHTIPNQGPRMQAKEVVITKPAGWTMPWAGAHACGGRPHGPRQANPRVENWEEAQAERKAARRARRAARRTEREAHMAAWRTHCERCYGELDAESALYHWSGRGPVCQECIEPDEEGLKWEAKAGFWR